MPRKNAVAYWGLAVFLTVGAILLFYDTLFGGREALGIFSHLLSALQPIIIGALIAYLLVPVINFIEEAMFSRLLHRARGEGRLFSRRARAVSIIVTWVIIGVAFYVLASVLLPELYRSVLQLADNVEAYYATISGWVEKLLESSPTLETWVTGQMEGYLESTEAWLTTKVLPQAQTVVSALSGGVVNTLVFLKNLLVGIIASIYFLATKERCAAHCRKVVYALFPQEKVYWILRGTAKVDRIFSGFVRGKLLDSLIIGILCFVGCSILKFPYTPLVSVIVGVTNVIPFFGPFLGAIPSTFLILLASPIQALYFVLFVLALQQLDGNFIGPKILGDKTGLSSLWVIVAILVGGSFFGLPGMFFGVPVCACLYSAANFFVERCLRRRKLPTDTECYTADPPQPPGGGERAQDGEKPENPLQ